MTHTSTANTIISPHEVQLYIIWTTDLTKCPTFSQRVTFKLLLSLDSGHYVKAYEGMEGQLRVFLVSVLNVQINAPATSTTVQSKYENYGHHRPSRRFREKTLSSLKGNNPNSLVVEPSA